MDVVSSQLSYKVMTALKIEKISHSNAATADAISHLLGQLTSTPHIFGEKELTNLINDPASSLFLLYEEGKIVGMLTICSYVSPIGRKLWIEDVVVDSAARGKGYGKRLVTYAIEYARTLSPCTLMLTSNPTRIAANELYQSSGFEQKTTNVYRLPL